MAKTRRLKPKQANMKSKKKNQSLTNAEIKMTLLEFQLYDAISQFVEEYIGKEKGVSRFQITPDAENSIDTINDRKFTKKEVKYLQSVQQKMYWKGNTYYFRVYNDLFKKKYKKNQ